MVPFAFLVTVLSVTTLSKPQVARPLLTLSYSMLRPIGLPMLVSYSIGKNITDP